MRFETILSLAAVAGVGYLLWERFGPTVQAGSGFALPYPQANRPFPAGGIVPAGAPMTPNCQLPCPDGMQCASVLDGMRDARGNCTPLQLRMN